MLRRLPSTLVAQAFFNEKKSALSKSISSPISSPTQSSPPRVLSELSLDFSTRTSLSHLADHCLPGSSFKEAYENIVKVMELKTASTTVSPEMEEILNALENLKRNPEAKSKLGKQLFAKLSTFSKNSSTMSPKLEEYKKEDHDLEVLCEGLAMLNKLRQCAEEKGSVFESVCSQLQTLIGEYVRFIESPRGQELKKEALNKFFLNN